MDKDGMVAVVRGTKNSGLCVTLLDGARQYTLLPNTVTRPFQTTSQASQAAGPNPYVVDNSAQAVDGRYASVYKTVHCNMVPTSPTMDVSEFPPQRVSLNKGYGNFEIGGLGSGETTFYPSRVTDSFRGGLTWPERGSVFSPRPSVEPDPFANSLRKYPSMSTERSTEMVERLINYAQFRNSKTQRLPTLRTEFSTRPKKNLEGDIRTDESPTRERSRRYEDSPITDRYERSRRDDDRYRRYDEGDRRYEKGYEVRNFRDFSRRGRESVRNVQISIDTQVEIPTMASKEVATVAKQIPSVRTVAIPMSPLPSILALSADTKTSKSIQTLKSQDITLLSRKSAQTCFSSIDITNKKIKNGRKSKSQEELRGNEVEDELCQLAQDLTGPEEKALRDDLVKKLKKINKADKSDRIKIKFGRCLKDQLFSEMDMKDFTRELSNQLLSKIKNNNVHCNSTNLYRTEIQSHMDNNGENCVDDIIKEWLRDIPIKNRDYLGKSIKKDHLLLSIADKIKSIVISKLKIDGDRSLKTEIIQLIEDIPIAVYGFDKRLYFNRLATDLVRKIKETITIGSHKVGKSNTDDKNNINGATSSKYSAIKEEEIKYYVREELDNFVRKFQLRICSEGMDELEVELTDIVLDAMITIQSGKEEKVKEDILLTLFDLLNITEYQANYFANNMILNMKKIFNDVPKIKSQTFIVLNAQKRDINAHGAIDENYIKANLVWYKNQIIEQINEWISSIEGLNPNDNFTKVVIHDLAGDIVDRHKYLELNPTTKASKPDEIEHLKYQIFKWINKLVGDDYIETIDKAPELMERIKNVPVPMLIKPQSTNQGYRQIGCDYYNRPCSKSRRASITVDYGIGIGRSNITVAIGSVPQSKTLPSGSAKPNTAGRMSDPSENRPQYNSNNMPAEQNTQEKIIEQFNKFLKDWVQRIPMSEKPELIEKCRLGIYNGIWKAISKIKMNPEALDNPHFYRDVLDDEIEELLNCLTQTPELKKQRNSLKAEVLEKAADINMHVAPAALNTSYKQQLVENITNNLPRTVNRADHRGQDLTKLYEEVIKLHLAEYFILYTKYKEDDSIKANVFKRKLLKEVHELVDGIKQIHGKELREMEINQYIEGVIHALQKVPVPNDETIKLETDEIILALEVEQWFSDLPLMPNEERMDVLSRRKYRDMLAKKLFELENSNEGEKEEQMKEEITKFLKRMPFIPGQAENMPFMVEELMGRVKSRPRYDTESDSKNAVAFVEPHGYEAFSRDMPLCSSYIEDQNESSYMIVGGERAADRSMAYGGQYVQGRNDPDSQQEWHSLGQSSCQRAMNASPQGAGPCSGRSTCSQSTSPPSQRDPDSQQEWLSLEQSAAPGAMKGSPQGAGTCCERPTCSQSTSLPPQRDPDSQQEWLSLEQSAAPGAMKGSPQDAGPCCGRPTCSQSTSLPPQRDPDSQQEWLSLEQSAAPGAMKGSLQDAGTCCGRPTYSQSTSLPPHRDLDSQQEWLSLEQSAAPGAMKGSPQHAGPCCGRPACSQSTSLPPHRDPDSQQEWLSLEQSAAPGAMKGSPQDAGPCCGRPTCSQSTSLPPQRDPNSQQQWLSLEQSAAPGAMKGSPQDAGPCCGRPACSQSTSLPPHRDPDSQQEWLSLEQSAAPGAMKGSSQDTGTCCGRPTRSQITSLPPQRTPNSQRERLSLGQSSGQGVMKGSPQGAGPCCGRPTRSQSGSPSQQGWLSLEQSKVPSAVRDTSFTPQMSTGSCCKQSIGPSQASTQSQTQYDSFPREQSGKVSKKQSKTANVSRGQSPSANAYNVSRGQSPAKSLPDNQSELVTSKANPKKSKQPKVVCECDKTPNTRKTSKNPPAGSISRGQSPASGPSDEESRPVSSKTKSKKAKSSPKVECGCITTPNTSKSSSAGKVSKGQLSSSDPSDEESKPVTSKIKSKKAKSSPKVECSCITTPKTSISPSASKISKGQLSAGGSSDKESKPVTSKTKSKKNKSSPKAECSCITTPISNKQTPNTTQTHSELPESTRRAAGSCCHFPEEFSSRPAGYSTPQQRTPGPPNMCRAKKGNRDIEQRREAARRRLEMEESDETDGDDLRCKCLERIWRWRRRGQCKPCDEDFVYPYPMMFPLPPPYFC